MNISLVISGMVPGGAERIMALLGNTWVGKGWSVTLITFDAVDAESYYPLDPRIRWKKLAGFGESHNPLQGVLNNLGRLKNVRKAIRESKPDVVISFLDRTNVVALLSTVGLGVPIIVSERNDPAACPIGRGWETLRNFSYRRARKVVVQTERAKNYFGAAIRNNSIVIPNPVTIPAEIARIPSGISDKPRRTIIGLGRLVEQKRFDRLIAAFAPLAPQFPDWDVTIWGEGPDRAALENQIKEIGLENRIFLPGATKQPFARLKESDLFVLSSRYEGFPNVLCEAMACGLPVISFDCPSGPREIIRPEADGLLVTAEDVPGLGAELQRLMGDADLRRKFAKNAPEIMDRFSLERVMALWESLFVK